MHCLILFLSQINASLWQPNASYLLCLKDQHNSNPFTFESNKNPLLRLLLSRQIGCVFQPFVFFKQNNVASNKTLLSTQSSIRLFNSITNTSVTTRHFAVTTSNQNLVITHWPLHKHPSLSVSRHNADYHSQQHMTPSKRCWPCQIGNYSSSHVQLVCSNQKSTVLYRSPYNAS